MPKPTLPLTGVNILRLLRDGKAHYLHELRESFGGNTKVSIELRDTISHLKKLGVISQDASTNALTVVPYKLEAIQRALGISLTELASYGDRSAVVVRPFFGESTENLARAAADIFVVMPFQPKLRHVYADHIVKVAESMRLSVKRGDDFFEPKAVMGDIWSAIFHAKVVVADCTGRNANVFYEIGLAHAVGTPVILTTQKAEDVPFDLRAIRHIEYQYTARGMRAFEKLLAATLRACRGRKLTLTPRKLRSSG